MGNSESQVQQNRENENQIPINQEIFLQRNQRNLNQFRVENEGDSLNSPLQNNIQFFQIENESNNSFQKQLQEIQNNNSQASERNLILQESVVQKVNKSCKLMNSTYMNVSQKGKKIGELDKSLHMRNNIVNQNKELISDFYCKMLNIRNEKKQIFKGYQNNQNKKNINNFNNQLNNNSINDNDELNSNLGHTQYSIYQNQNQKSYTYNSGVFQQQIQQFQQNQVQKNIENNRNAHNSDLSSNEINFGKCSRKINESYMGNSSSCNNNTNFYFTKNYNRIEEIELLLPRKMKDIIEQLQGEICLDDHIVQNYIFPYINSYGNDQNQIQKQNNQQNEKEKLDQKQKLIQNEKNYTEKLFYDREFSLEIKIEYYLQIYRRIQVFESQNKLKKGILVLKLSDLSQILSVFLSQLILDQNQEDFFNREDLRNKKIDYLYGLMKKKYLNISNFCYKLMIEQNSVQVQEFLTECFLKRIFQDLKLNKIQSNRKNLKEIMVFMGEMVKVAQFCDIFLQQSSFFKSQTDTGQDLEQNTIFGIILSFWDSQAFENKWAVKKSQQENIQLFQEIANQVNQNVNENIGLLYQILYQIVQIGGIKNQMKLIEWFNKAVLLNHQKLRTFNEYNTQSQDSFTLNLLKLSTLVFKGLTGKFQHLKMMSNMVDCSILVEHQMGIFHQFSKLADFESADFEMVGPEIEGKLAEKSRILTHFLVICLQNVNLNSKVIQDLSFGFEEGFCQQEIIAFFKAQSLLMDFEQILNIFNCFCLLIFRALQLNQVKIQQFKESFFYNGQIKLVQIDKEQIKDEISPIYSQLPDTFIENLYSILISLQQQQYLDNKSQQLQEQLYFICQFLVILMEKDKWLTNPHSKMQCLKILDVVTNLKFRNQKEFVDQLYQSSVFKEFLFSALMKIANKQKKIQMDDNNLEEKFGFYYNFNQVVQHIFGKSQYSEVIDNYCEQEYKSFYTFFTSYLGFFLTIMDKFQEEVTQFSKIESEMIEVFQPKQDKQKKKNKKKKLIIFAENNNNNNEYQQEEEDGDIQITENNSQGQEINKGKQTKQQRKLINKYIKYLINMKVKAKFLEDYSLCVYLLQGYEYSYLRKQEILEHISNFQVKCANQLTELQDIFQKVSKYQVFLFQQQMDLNNENQNQKQHYNLENNRNQVFESIQKIQQQVFRVFYFLSGNQSYLEKISEEKEFDIDKFRFIGLKQTLSGEESDQFYVIMQELEKMAENAKFLEYLVEKQDCPSEFLDPLVCTIMKNPVKLPNSQQIVDKNTIVKHLLEDQNDPFTRSALQIEEVVEMDELRHEIEIFLQKEKATYIQKMKNESSNKKHQDKKEIFQVDFNAKLEQNEGDI